MKKNKTIYIALILMLLAFPLSARDIRVEGSGSSREEAEVDARYNLANYLSLDISGTTELRVGDDGSSSSISLQEAVTSSTSVQLLGVEMTRPKQSGGIWTVTAYISEKSQDLYMERVKNLVPVISNISMNKTGTLEEKIAYYSKAKMQFRDWETYLMILQILSNGTYEAPVLPISHQDVDSRYNALLISLNTTISQETYLLDEQAKRGDLSQEQIDRRKQLEREKLEIQNSLDSLYREQAKQKEAFARMADKDIEEYLTRLSNISIPMHPQVAVTNPVQFIVAIEDYRNTYRDAKNELANELYDTFNEFEVQAEKLAIDRMSANRLTNIALVDSNGYPTADYIEIQMANDMEPAILELYKAYYINARKMYDVTMGRLAEIRGGAEEYLDILNNARLTVSRYSKEVTSSIRYIGQEWKWKGKAYLSIAGQEIDVDFEIPFEKVTGIKGDFKRWTELEPVLNTYHAILTQSDNAYDVIVSYHIEGSLVNNRYRIYIDEVKVINPLAIGDDAILYSAKDIKSVEFSITDNNMDLTLVYVSNKFDIHEMLPQYEPLGLIPDPDLAVPDIANVKKAKKHTSDELPEPNFIEERKIRLDTASSKHLGLSLGGGTEYNIDGTRTGNPYSFGFFWRSRAPLFSNAHFRISLGGRLTENGGSLIDAGGSVGLDFMHYLDTYTYLSYGISTDVAYTLGSDDVVSVIPVASFGFGGEMKYFNTEVQAFCGCSLNSTSWTPELCFGARFKVGIYLL